MANAREMLDDVDNVGIMQGFLDEMEDDMGEGEDGEEENSAAKMLDRRPDSPEILMNNLRGDMRSVDARREELADLVGYAAAAETPDSVLAMLQPVLAQGGGLGALPQSMPMAQGPQAPMPPGPQMPPPPGPMAPPLPAGAPMVPPEAMMPPQPQDGGIAALLAGGAPGGGQAPPQAPIGMKDGGYVQRFSNGSTEEAVAPLDEEGLPEDNRTRSAADLLYSPELVNYAQNIAASTLAQRPTAVPSLESAMKTRLPEYERLLGDNKESSQAALLFELAGAGLNLAANRGPRGEVLRGSPMARLAGAFSNIPAAVQKRVMDIEDTQRKLRMLAIQAGEKDRDEIQNLNSKLMTEKRSILNNILTADARMRASTARGAGLPPTGSRTNWEMNTFLEPGLMDRFASGQTTPQENNAIASAITSYTEPRYEAVIDPVTKRPTGKYTPLPGKTLPDFVIQAQKLRNSGTVPAGTNVTLSRTATPAAISPVGEADGETPEPLLSEGGREATEAGTARTADRPIDEPTYMSREEAFASPVSLWRDRSKIAGPFAAVYATFSATPGFGDPLADITRARSQANFVAKDALEPFLKSEQKSVTEQLMIKNILELQPAVMRDPENYGTRLIALSTLLDQIIEENQQKASTVPGTTGATLAPEQVALAREKLTALKRLKSNLGLPPAVYSEEEISRLPPGVTEVLWMGVTPAKIKGR